MFRFFKEHPDEIVAQNNLESAVLIENKIIYRYNFTLTPSSIATEEEHFKSISEFVDGTIKGKKLIELTFYPQHELRALFQNTFQKISTQNNSYADVRLLWHGTPTTENIDSIMTNNYDMSIVGKNMGTKGSYGAGIYFSEDGYYCPNDKLILNYVRKR